MIPPIHPSNDKTYPPRNIDKEKGQRKPFQNTRTKSDYRSINIFDSGLIDEEENEPETVDPTISAFVKDQLSYEDSIHEDCGQIQDIDMDSFDFGEEQNIETDEGGQFMGV